MTIVRGRGLMAIVAVAAAAGLGACGGEDDQEKAAGVAQAFLDGDPAVCDNLTAEVLEYFGDGNVKRCRHAIRELGEHKGTVESVSIRGSKATVTARRKTVGRGPIWLVKRDGDWMVSGVGRSDRQRRALEIAAQPKIQPDLGAKEATDAYMRAIRAGDARAFCGLITPRQALKVLGSNSAGSEEPLRECVSALSFYDWREDSKRAKGVKTTGVQIRGETAIVELSSGKRAKLEQYEGRWVVDDVSKASG
jgi:hypothetical protein